MFKIAHISDTHIGFSQYSVTNSDGRNLRTVDFEEATLKAFSMIDTYDPDIIIHSGDVFDSHNVNANNLVFLWDILKKYSKKQNGEPRPIFIVAGNHDTPKNRDVKSPLEIFKNIPNVYVSSETYERIKLEDNNLFIHLLPDRALTDLDHANIKPIKGARNILSTHGVAAQSPLYSKIGHRENYIPGALLMKNWDYVALGHYHEAGEIQISNKKIHNVWYAGSVENTSFNPGSKSKCFIKIELNDTINIQQEYFSIREHHSLKPLDCETYNTTTILKNSIISHLKSNTVPVGSIVNLNIINIDQALYSELDLSEINDEASIYHNFTINAFFKDSESGSYTDLGKEELIDNIIKDNYNDNFKEIKFMINTKLSEIEKELTVNAE